MTKAEITCHKEPFEYVEIKGMYSDAELADIFAELSFINKAGLLLDPELTGSAVDENNNIMKRNKALFLDDLFQDRNSSMILRHNRKLFGLNLPYETLNPVFNAVEGCDRDNTLISYYENSDFYKPHRDGSMLTALTYFYSEPKKFTGGNLEIPRCGVSLEAVNNVTYLFCGREMHGVSPVMMNEHDLGKNLGRYCMTQFIHL